MAFSVWRDTAGTRGCRPIRVCYSQPVPKTSVPGGRGTRGDGDTRESMNSTVREAPVGPAGIKRLIHNFSKLLRRVLNKQQRVGMPCSGPAPSHQGAGADQFGHRVISGENTSCRRAGWSAQVGSPRPGGARGGRRSVSDAWSGLLGAQRRNPTALLPPAVASQLQTCQS